MTSEEYKIPKLYEDQEKGKYLMLQFEKCTGCGLCIEVCPTKVLEKGDKLNTKVAYPPKIVDGKECKFCQECELICPDLSIYVIEVGKND
ncbi:MAG: 4Fe-4S dicluster domain-containing protein [Candidatus Helarchaeota archaeon]